MRKLLFTLVLSVFALAGWCQTEPLEALSLTDSPTFKGIVDVQKHFAGDDDWIINNENWPTESSQILNSSLGFRYTDLMSIYKGRSLQLVKDIDSGRLFWSPMQSVLDKPFESTVYS